LERAASGESRSPIERGGLDRLRDRPERDPFAVGQTPAGQRSRAIADQRRKLAHQTRLAHPGVADDGRHSTRAERHGFFERLLEPRQLFVSTDERRVQATRELRCAGRHLQ
jgi:hypothetical protein